MRIAVIDDWQDVARSSADWEPVERRARLAFLHDAYPDEDAAAVALEDFDGVVPMRDRTWFTRSLLERLPRLRVIAQTGTHAIHIDLDACAERGITVLGCDRRSHDRSATAELCLGLILAASHGIVRGDANLRAGRWQDGIPLGEAVRGKTIGLLGLGNVGGRVAGFAAALGMDVLAWSPNLTAERAAASGAALVSKDELFSRPDIVSLHLVATPATAGIVGAAELALLRDGALLVNTARAALVDQAAMRAELESGRIGAALDVFDTEPLPADDPLRRAPNVVMTPHLGFVKRDLLESFYGGVVDELAAWLGGEPATVLRAPAPGRPG